MVSGTWQLTTVPSKMPASAMISGTWHSWTIPSTMPLSRTNPGPLQSLAALSTVASCGMISVTWWSPTVRSPVPSCGMSLGAASSAALVARARRPPAGPPPCGVLSMATRSSLAARMTCSSAISSRMSWSRLSASASLDSLSRSFWQRRWRSTLRSSVSFWTSIHTHSISALSSPTSLSFRLLALLAAPRSTSICLCRSSALLRIARVWSAMSRSLCRAWSVHSCAASCAPCASLHCASFHAQAFACNASTAAMPSLGFSGSRTTTCTDTRAAGAVMPAP
mmetsp:Transcript_21166/g.66383  ORF Transcript_21166/g.66383 Transcript_21166/m.66383 type:complete len:280 (+) Transcript_21166:2-841(+)